MFLDSRLRGNDAGHRYTARMTLLYLILAIIFEVGWAIAMKLSDGMTKLAPTVAMIVMYLLSVVFLALATKKLDISVAYALWAGSGAALIAIIGIVHFKEPVTALKLVSIGLIVLGIVGVQLSGGADHQLSPANQPAQQQSTT